MYLIEHLDKANGVCRGAISIVQVRKKCNMAGVVRRVKILAIPASRHMNSSVEPRL